MAIGNPPGFDRILIVPYLAFLVLAYVDEGQIAVLPSTSNASTTTFIFVLEKIDIVLIRLPSDFQLSVSTLNTVFVNLPQKQADQFQTKEALQALEQYCLAE